MASSLGRTYQNSMCGAVLAALCYLKARQDAEEASSSSSVRSEPIIKAEPVKIYLKYIHLDISDEK